MLSAEARIDGAPLHDDGEHRAPSKRIIAHNPEYDSVKSTVGARIADLIGLDVIRAKCPHFNGWLSRLESLASSSGLESSEP